jgi:soluble lytic murein transglycosylase
VRLRLPLIFLTVAVCVSAGTHVRTAASPRPPQGTPVDLRPTAHRAVPSALEEYWYVPPAGWRPARADAWSAARDLAKASDLIANGKAAQAVPLIRPAALTSTPLAGYASYLEGLAQARLDHRPAARAIFTKLLETKPAGALADSINLRLGELADADGDFAGAAAIYEALLAGKPGAPDDLLLRMMRAARAAGDAGRAAKAWQALHYDWPTSEAAAIAEREMPSGDPEPLVAGSRRFDRELARAEKLFAARRYAVARVAFAALAPHASGDGGELVRLRVAECDVLLRRLRGVRDDLRPLIDSSARRAEARYYDLLAARDLGRHDEFASLVRALVDAYPDSAWSEDALNALATFLIVDNQDARADEVLRELASRFPSGRYTARALWRTGWWAYRDGRYAAAADVFERAAAAFPRSDYRPSYLYWAAKARDKAGDTATADARFRLTIVEYANSYYGRQSAIRLASRGIPVPGGAEAARTWPGTAPEAGAPPNVELIRWLIAAEMYDSALAEVQYAERTQGTSPMLQATRAYLLNRTGDLRPGINLMRQAYPQFLAAGGETLPPEILKVIYPLEFWPLIREQAAANKLDPYLVAALIAQESTFDKDAKSSANAYGLMQIVPATGKRWARRLGIRNYSTRRLTVPEVNVRIGTAYFADLVQQFGGVHVALAGYNAGDGRAAKWATERRGLPQDEFIDDIPFPETQAYVRRILGTADDYRRLYGGTTAASSTPAPPADSSHPKPVIIRPPVKR